MLNGRTEEQHRDDGQRNRRVLHKRDPSAAVILAAVREGRYQRIGHCVEHTRNRSNQTEDGQKAANHQSRRNKLHRAAHNVVLRRQIKGDEPRADDTAER